jgi:hypothetical protein
MSIPLDTNKLTIFRRHKTGDGCVRYPGNQKKPPTYKPKNKKEEKADVCRCPVWCIGYLSGERHSLNGKTKLKRIYLSLGEPEGPTPASDWTAAETKVAFLYERGRVELPTPATDPNQITVEYAGKRYLDSRRDGAMDPLEPSSWDKFSSLINTRLIPYCETHQIVFVKEFERQDACRLFTESWRQQRRAVGKAPDIRHDNNARLHEISAYLIIAVLGKRYVFDFLGREFHLATDNQKVAFAVIQREVRHVVATA